MKAYAGAVPVTRASGKTVTVTVSRRRIKNDRMAAAGYLWAFCAITRSPGADTLYRHLRDNGQYRASSLRRLFAKLLGSLHHCLKIRTPYQEALAFPGQANLALVAKP